MEEEDARERRRKRILNFSQDRLRRIQQDPASSMRPSPSSTCRNRMEEDAVGVPTSSSMMMKADGPPVRPSLSSSSTETAPPPPAAAADPLGRAIRRMAADEEEADRP